MAAIAAAASVSACSPEKPPETPHQEKPPPLAPIVQSPKTYHWRMATVWPPHLPVLRETAERFVNRVAQASAMRIRIDIVEAKDLALPRGLFDAVSTGEVEVGVGASNYWAGQAPAALWFSSVPFGFNPQGMNTWLYATGGLELWEETYAPFNVIPRPLGNLGLQMGGWFKKRIDRLDDYRGLKVRMTGLGGKVMTKTGATVVLTAGGALRSNLERDVLDVAAWFGPYWDLQLELYRAAKYYYYPCWHEPGTALEVIFNKYYYDTLPSELKVILDAVAAETNIWSLCRAEAHNGAALDELVAKHRVKLVRYPDAILDALQSLADEVLEIEAAKSLMAKKVHEAFKKARTMLSPWGTVSEKAYWHDIAVKYPRVSR